MGSAYELERLVGELRGRIDRSRRLIEELGKKLDMLRKLVEELKTSGITVDQTTKKKIEDILKWSEDIDATLDSIKRAYRVLVTQVVLRVLPVGPSIESCSEDYTNYHDKVLELVGFSRTLKDRGPTIYLENIVKNIEEFRRDPCYVLRDPQSVNLLYEIDRLRATVTEKLNTFFECESYSRLESLVGQYISSSISMDELKERTKTLKDLLTTLLEVTNEYGKLADILANLEKLNEELSRIPQATFMTGRLVKSLTRDIASLTDSLRDYKSKACNATNFEKIIDVVNCLTRGLIDLKERVDQELGKYRSCAHDLSIRFGLRIPELDKLQLSAITMNEIRHKIPLLRSIDIELAKFIDGVLGEKRRVLEKILQLADETGARYLMVDRNLLQRLTPDELKDLLDLCVNGVLTCTITF